MAAFELDKKQNRESSALGVLKGAAAGAVAGAGIGAAGGPYGALIGAAIGGVAGGIRGGVTEGVTDAAAQRDIYKAEQAQAKIERDQQIDSQALARSSAPKMPRAARYAGGVPSAYSTPAVGKTSYDSWKAGGN